MKTIQVLTPNGETHQYTGERVFYSVSERGELHILDWQTDNNNQGTTTFAAHEWTRVDMVYPR